MTIVISDVNDPPLTCCLVVLYDLVLTVDRFRSLRASRRSWALEVDSSTPVLFKKGEFLTVKPGFEIPCDDWIRCSWQSEWDGYWGDVVVSNWDNIDEEFGCFVAVGLGMVLKKGHLVSPCRKWHKHERCWRVIVTKAILCTSRTRAIRTF